MNPNQSIIDSGKKFVVSVAGGGQGALAALTSSGGMSNSLLEGRVPYSMTATDDFLGGKPDRYVDERTARQLAMACFARARALAPDEHPENLLGVALTGAVVKVGGEREGRRHQLCLATQTYNETMSFDITLREGRTRMEEEVLAGACLVAAVKLGCGIAADLRKYTDNEPYTGDFVKFRRKMASQDTSLVVLGELDVWPPVPAKLIFPSSCNPLHDGHLAILRHARENHGSRVDIELCVRPMDKPPLDYIEIDDRLEALNKLCAGEDSVGRVLLSSNALFSQKAAAYPGATFLVGYDTIRRVNDPAYYKDGLLGVLNTINALNYHNCRFKVYPRIGEKNSLEGVQEAMLSRIELVKDEAFIPVNISSSILRSLGGADQ